MGRVKQPVQFSKSFVIKENREIVPHEGYQFGGCVTRHTPGIGCGKIRVDRQHGLQTVRGILRVFPGETYYNLVADFQIGKHVLHHGGIAVLREECRNVLLNPDPCRKICRQCESQEH